jgi:adenine-specific DNA-methyltransferase
VVDLFSGTSVVSQAFAAIGNDVIAVDTQLACQTMASALLGIGRSKEQLDAELSSEIIESAESLDLKAPWNAILASEDIALRQQDDMALDALNQRMPSIWNVRENFAPLESLLAAPGRSAVGIAPLFALTLAGSYFGVRQALAIDSLRWAIEDAQARDRLTTWQSAALTTAVMAAMSKAVCSAGKHFAQPLTSGGVTGRHFRIRPRGGSGSSGADPAVPRGGDRVGRVQRALLPHRRSRAHHRGRSQPRPCGAQSIEARRGIP